jgi:hypothetical protein
LAKTPSPSSPHGSEQRRGGSGRRPALEEGAPAALASAAAGDWGNTKRGTRGSYPRAHLGPRRREEADRRWWSEGGDGARGGGAVVLGEGLWMPDCGAVRRGRVVSAFYRRPKAVPGRNISPATSTPAPVVVGRGGSSGPVARRRDGTGRGGGRRAGVGSLQSWGGRPAGPAGGSAGGGDAAV